MPGVAVTIPSIPQTTFVTDDNGEVEVEITKKLPFILDYTASKDDASVMGTAVLIKSCSVQLIPASISCISTIIFTVTNAADNSPLAGATISIDSSPPDTLDTDANGEAQIEITEQLPSSLEYSASIDGFIGVRGTVTKTCSVQFISVSLWPIVIVDRVELRWTSPGDLDHRVIQYDENDNSCEIRWNCRNCCPDSFLDQDDFGPNGRETITWRSSSNRYLIFALRYGSLLFINSGVSNHTLHTYFY